MNLFELQARVLGIDAKLEIGFLRLLLNVPREFGGGLYESVR